MGIVRLRYFCGPCGAVADNCLDHLRGIFLGTGTDLGRLLFWAPCVVFGGEGPSRPVSEDGVICDVDGLAVEQRLRVRFTLNRFLCNRARNAISIFSHTVY